MYKKPLANKLESIFKFKQIIFGNPMGSKTQNVAWVIPESNVPSFDGDKRTFFVTGEIVVVNPLAKMPVGRLYEKYQLAQDKTPGTFIVTTSITEGFDHGDNQLTAQKFGFIFDYTEQYNPPKPLKGIRWIYNILGINNG